MCHGSRITSSHDDDARKLIPFDEGRIARQYLCAVLKSEKHLENNVLQHSETDVGQHPSREKRGYAVSKKQRT